MTTMSFKKLYTMFMYKYYNDKREELIEKLIDDGYEWEED